MALIDLYTRLSVLKDGSDSIERQEAELRAEAARQGKTVRKVWSDGKSGYKDVKRPDFDEAIKAVTTGEVAELWVWKLDRLSRQGAGKVGTILDDLEKIGGKLWFMRDSLDSSIQGHRMVIVMVSEQARGESANTSLRVTAKNDSNISKGFPVVGKRRFGFQSGNRKAHPEEAPKVKALYQEYLSGASLRSLAAQMGWTLARVRDTLSNPSYAGWVVRGDERYPAHESIDRIISQEDFDAVQIRLSTTRGPQGGGQTTHLASGIALCGICKSSLNFSNEYKCVGNLSHPTVREHILDKKMIDAVVAALVFGPATAEVSNLNDIDAQLAKIKAQRQEVISLIDPDLGITKADVAPKLAELAKKANELEVERAELVASNAQVKMMSELQSKLFAPGKVSMDDAVELRKHIRSEFMNLEFEQKRELLKAHLHVEVYPGRGEKRIKVTQKIVTSLNA